LATKVFYAECKNFNSVIIRMSVWQLTYRKKIMAPINS